MPPCLSRNGSRGPGYFSTPEIFLVIPRRTDASTSRWRSQRTSSTPPKPPDTTVVITESTSHPTEAGPIEQLLRIVQTDVSGTQTPNNVLWEPNKSKGGNVAIVISELDKRIEILRGGVLIGQASISLAEPETSLPEALYVKLQPNPGKPSPDWSAVLTAGSPTTTPSQLLGRFKFPRRLAMSSTSFSFLAPC
jgi:hypothetical protein